MLCPSSGAGPYEVLISGHDVSKQSNKGCPTSQVPQKNVTVT